MQFFRKCGTMKVQQALLHPCFRELPPTDGSWSKHGRMRPVSSVSSGARLGLTAQEVLVNRSCRDVLGRKEVFP